jgi:hypothetical protein
MSKPRKTVADYMAIALSPVLIMALVGSLCFFLIEVFYRGQMVRGVCWVMFWFIIGIVLVSRIAIEKSTEHAVIYGLGLAAATCLYLIRTQPAYPLGMVLLGIVWFCAHKLVWDCTLIDEEQDSSGLGLLEPAATPEQKAAAHPPGRLVVWFSLAALPLFGLGQVLLPEDAVAARRTGFALLVSYLAAALGLLVTTSFLGLRRYLRQRYLRMPPVMAAAWLKLGAGVACVALIGAVFLPRPGAPEAWAALRYQIDYQLRRAGEYAAPGNPPGQGQRGEGSRAGGKPGSAPASGQAQVNQQAASQQKPGGAHNMAPPHAAATASSAPTGDASVFLRRALLIAAGLAVIGWILLRRHLLLEMARSLIAAVAQFLRQLFNVTPSRPPAAPAAAGPVLPRFSSFAKYKNPFLAGKEAAWPPKQIILYSYEAVQVWAKERGMAARPDETAGEFCGRLSGRYPELEWVPLARLYAHAAYGTKLPADCDLEPIRALWRLLPSRAV